MSGPFISFLIFNLLLISNINMTNIPMRKTYELKQKLNVAVTEQVYKEYHELKVLGVDMAAWLRQLIAQELPKLKQRL